MRFREFPSTQKHLKGWIKMCSDNYQTDSPYVDKYLYWFVHRCDSLIQWCTSALHQHTAERSCQDLGDSSYTYTQTDISCHSNRQVDDNVKHHWRDSTEAAKQIRYYYQLTHHTPPLLQQTEAFSAQGHSKKACSQIHKCKYVHTS